ncbi:MAG: class II aldolase/adducin family protein, partial [Bacteroides sp.]
MEDRKAVILANHGILTGGRDLQNAFSIAEDIE